MKYTIEPTPETLLVCIDGPYVGDAPALEMKDEIKEQLLEGMANILIDMEDCSVASSQGIGGLISIFHSVKVAGAHMKLCSVTNRVKHSLVVTGVWDLFDTYPSREEAMRSFRPPVV